MKLSQFPTTEYNLTQFGDASIFLSFLTIFIIYAPKLWEALLSSLLIATLFSCLVKEVFDVPRPAAVFDDKSFVIIGKTLSGHNSLPSGHCITIFSILTVLLFAFSPNKFKSKILWFILIISTGLTLAFTRVAVGAHHPLDVIIGCILGSISGILGIFIYRKYKIWKWINNKKYYPVFILLLLICSISVINKIIHENLFLFYLSFFSLVISLFKITIVYVKR
ncbi:phosphatase PAP2 family protein [Flavobacterium poyangense]|uniref:phosphatase PAP2 family protein n=1 Tax=Flavobacterium poyangense TaxID=2204302 RepID=UPI0027D34DA4|nr:phosphatase PAP2 family protein [Flavobacterium sp. JXAS1]